MELRPSALSKPFFLQLKAPYTSGHYADFTPHFQPLQNSVPQSPEVPAGLFCCQICPATFTLVDDSVVHLLTTHCVILLQCPLCGATSYDSASLHAHITLAHRNCTPQSKPPHEKCHPLCLWQCRDLTHHSYCIVRKSNLV